MEASICLAAAMAFRLYTRLESQICSKVFLAVTVPKPIVKSSVYRMPCFELQNAYSFIKLECSFRFVPFERDYLAHLTSYI